MGLPQLGLSARPSNHQPSVRRRKISLIIFNADLACGETILKATERGRLTARQIEAGRRAMTRHIKRGGKIWIRVFPDKPITKKPLEVRQGKGKGNVEYWVCQIQPGRVLYEMEGVTEEVAREAFRLAAAKLPFPTTFVERQVM